MIVNALDLHVLQERVLNVISTAGALISTASGALVSTASGALVVSGVSDTYIHPSKPSGDSFPVK